MHPISFFSGVSSKPPLPIHADARTFRWIRNHIRPDGNAPLRGFKGSTWEGGYREPGIAWWPGKIAAGSRSDALVATYDIFPTVLSVAKVALPPVTFDGIDISAVLFGQQEEAHDCIYFYKWPYAAAGDDPTNLAAVR